MTFDAYETSADQGEPLLLFDFFVGLTHWQYTTADRPITWLTQTFTPIAISAGSIDQGNEIRRKTLSVEVPADTEIVQVLQQYPPSGDVMLVITALHQTDPDQQGIAVFIGRVMSQSQTATTVTLACEPAYTGVKATGLRRRFQLNCAHVLYSQGDTQCTVNPALVMVATTLSSAAGPVLTCAGLVPPTGLSWPGGYVEWIAAAGYVERRSINSAAGDVLTLAYGSPDLVLGLALNVFPGCDHSTANCTAYGTVLGTEQLLNFGGQPWIPSVNPMVGNPIY
jgi:hypothetical protein